MRAIDHVNRALRILRTGDDSRLAGIYREAARKNEEIAERKKREMTAAGYKKSDIDDVYATWMSDADKQRKRAELEGSADASYGGGRYGRRRRR